MNVEMGTDASRTIKPPGWIDGAGFHRGHLLAAQLGGSGKDPRNLVTLLANPNQSAMRTFENAVRRNADIGQEVMYTVVPRYTGPGRPAELGLVARGQYGYYGATVIDNT
jgi:hypothetical protein